MLLNTLLFPKKNNTFLSFKKSARIEFASTQTKSQQRGTQEIQPAQAGFVCVEAVSTAELIFDRITAYERKLTQMKTRFARHKTKKLSRFFMATLIFISVNTLNARAEKLRCFVDICIDP